jgi:Amt family ammonium transporter
LHELVAVVLSSVWAFGFTYGMLWLIDRVTPVHVTQGVEEVGLDAGLLHEEAYLEGSI